MDKSTGDNRTLVSEMESVVAVLVRAESEQVGERDPDRAEEF